MAGPHTVAERRLAPPTFHWKTRFRPGIRAPLHVLHIPVPKSAKVSTILLSMAGLAIDHNVIG